MFLYAAAHDALLT